METQENNTNNINEDEMKNTPEQGVPVDQATPPPVAQDPAPQMSSPMEGEPKEEQKSAGAIVGSIIIIVIIIIGGLYFWGQQLSKNDTVLEGPTVDEIVNTPDETLDTLNTQSNSDAITDIEADLNANVLNGLDSDLDNIDLNF